MKKYKIDWMILPHGMCYLLSVIGFVTVLFRYSGPDYSMGFAHAVGHYFFYHFLDRILWNSMQLILIWIEGKVHFLILSDQIIRPLVFKALTLNLGEWPLRVKTAKW